MGQPAVSRQCEVQLMFNSQVDLRGWCSCTKLPTAQGTLRAKHVLTWKLCFSLCTYLAMLIASACEQCKLCTCSIKSSTCPAVLQVCMQSLPQTLCMPGGNLTSHTKLYVELHCLQVDIHIARGSHMAVSAMTLHGLCANRVLEHSTLYVYSVLG